jgi:COP9 signalosome complex subunit 7
METAKFEQEQAPLVAYFVEKAKAQNGAAGVADVVTEAVSNEKLFVFGELLQLECVQALQVDAAHGRVFRLLKLFAFGTFADAAGADVPTLTTEQAAKLRLLSIVTLAQDVKLIPYASLLSQLAITEIRELEDVVIDAIYSGLMNAKLDQKNKAVEVLSAIGRDVEPADIAKMQQKLAQWAGASRSVIQAIEEKTQFANAKALEEQRHQAQIAEQIANVKAILKASAEDDGMPAAKHRVGAGSGGRSRPSRPS